MSDDEKRITSPALCKLSSTNNKMYTPCRTIGLKRRSTGTPLHTNSLKKVKLISEEKKIELNKNSIAINGVTQDKSNRKLNYNVCIKPTSILNKQREIEQLKSELKNCEQHNLIQVQELSNKWLQVCQKALMSLLNQLNQNRSTNLQRMEDLIKNLGIDYDLIHFDCNNQEFY